MSHTPGPWRVAELSASKYYGTDIESDSGVVVSRLGCVADCETPSERATPNDYDGHYEKAETLANAKLIAAAPDLLAALKIAVAEMESLYGYYESEFRISSDPPDTEYESKVVLINAAIAKAEGRAGAVETRG